MKGNDLPRERFQSQGPDSLTDAELLAVLLRTGTQGKNVIELANELLSSFDNNLLDLSSANVEQLCEINGIGEAKAVGLCAVFALARRLLKLRLAIRPLFNNPEVIAEYMRDVVQSRDKEETHVFLLDSQCRLIRDELISIGILDRALLHPREIFRPAVREASRSFILCHTHPSDDPTPSIEDIKLTYTLLMGAEIIDIAMVDHLVVALRPAPGRSGFFSFCQHGLLNLEKLKQSLGSLS
ncbi:MAG: DNA repair protein RadC [Victivallales bacterium]|nr:DNA repair protein RadC [Victivallales bacterium]